MHGDRGGRAEHVLSLECYDLRTVDLFFQSAHAATRVLNLIRSQPFSPQRFLHSHLQKILCETCDTVGSGGDPRSVEELHQAHLLQGKRVCVCVCAREREREPLCACLRLVYATWRDAGRQRLLEA